MALDPRQRNEFLNDEGVPANRHVNLKAWGEPEGISPGEWQESGRVRASGSVSSMRMTSRRDASLHERCEFRHSHERPAAVRSPHIG